MATSNLFSEVESGASAWRKLWSFLGFFCSPALEGIDVRVKLEILTGVKAQAPVLEGRGLLEFFLSGFTDTATLLWQSPNICAQAATTSSFINFKEFLLDYKSL